MNESTTQPGSNPALISPATTIAPVWMPPASTGASSAPDGWVLTVGATLLTPASATASVTSTPGSLVEATLGVAEVPA